VIARGDIRWFRFASPDKRRPVLVLGLPSPCVLEPEWIRIVERPYLGPLIAQLPDERFPAVRAALIDALGLR
jgi:mRNA-degrading endonuclease toxin of MazEF toxin-antitoxin module